MSTDLLTYLNYMSTWVDGSDAEIEKLINEQKTFISLDNFDAGPAIDSVFNDLVDKAHDVRDRTIAADATQMAADAAALASIWSFGLGMGAFLALEISVVAQKAYISSHSKDLNTALTNADTNISQKVNPTVASYVSQYKANNLLISSKAPAGLDTKHCRANLMQFMASMQKKSGKLDVATFRQYAHSARTLFNSPQIQKVYDAMDDLNFSGKSKEDAKKYLDTLKGLDAPTWLSFGLSGGLFISMNVVRKKMNIADKLIKELEKELGMDLEMTAFEAMDAVGKFAFAVGVVVAVVDVVLQIIDIIDVVKQCEKMCEALEGDIKKSYKTYFTSIKDSATHYREAMEKSSDNKA